MKKDDFDELIESVREAGRILRGEADSSPNHLDDLTPEEIEEAARRYQQLEAGTASSIPSEEVFARLEARRRR